MIPPRPVYFYKPCGRIDYAAMRNHVTRGTKTRKQLLAIEARAARKAAQAAEKALAKPAPTRSSGDPMPPRVRSLG